MIVNEFHTAGGLHLEDGGISAFYWIDDGLA
jgi:hypothetical protein